MFLRLSCLFISLLLASACGTQTAAPSDDYDPFSALTGKADGGSFDEVEWTLSYDSERERLTIEGVSPDGQTERARYNDVEVEVHPGAYRRYRLKRGDRFATMRSLLLVDTEWTSLRDTYRLAEAMGLATPRVASARHSEDDASYDVFTLVEHVGDRFLRRHFDGEGNVLREAAERAELSATLLRRDVSALRAIEETFDPSSLGAALGLEEFSSITSAFAELEDGLVVAFVEVGVSTPLEGGRNALFTPRVREEYETALESASECYDDDDCYPDSERLSALIDEQTRRESGDAPTGDAYYAHHRVVDAFTTEIRFRHLTPEHYASEVELDFGGDVQGLEYDNERDLWIGRVDAPATSTDYAIYARFADGSEGVEARTLSPELDELFEVQRADIDVREPSGLALFGERLLVVGDEGNDVYFLDMNGVLVDQVEVGVRGMEGVAVDLLHSELLVTDEDRGDIVRFSLEGEELDRMHFRWADEASGIEGLSVDARTGHVLFAKESSPSSIAAVDASGDELFRERVDFASDLSALAIDASEGVLYALSDQDRTLYRLNDDLEVVVRWQLDIRKPEGLVVDSGRVYIASDEDNELVIFDLVR